MHHFPFVWLTGVVFHNCNLRISYIRSQVKALLFREASTRHMGNFVENCPPFFLNKLINLNCTQPVPFSVFITVTMTTEVHYPWPCPCSILGNTHGSLLFRFVEWLFLLVFIKVQNVLWIKMAEWTLLGADNVTYSYGYMLTAFL